VVVGAHQVVAAGFAGRIGAVRCVGRGFAESGVGVAERSVHLVGADVQEAEGGLVGLRHGAPVGTNFFQQAEGAYHVGVDELAWAVDGAVNMTFSRKVQDGAGPVLGQSSAHSVAVGNVCLHQGGLARGQGAGDGVGVARVGELVKHHHFFSLGAMAGQPVMNEITADEPCATCYQNHDSQTFEYKTNGIISVPRASVHDNLTCGYPFPALWGGLLHFLATMPID
jgi:hypothetical protein